MPTFSTNDFDSEVGQTDLVFGV